MKKLIIPVLTMFLLSGCFVSVKKYEMKENEAIELTEKLSLMNKEKEELEKEIAGLREDAENLSTSLESTQNQKNQMISELTKTKNDLEEKISALEKEMETLKQEKEKAIESMKNSYDNLVNKMESEIKEGEIVITQLKNKLTVNMVDKILFKSGEAEVMKKGEQTLGKVGTVLKKITDKQIRIEGHTDNIPISKEYQTKFPTNWELSAARATNVARYLIDKAELDPKMISVAGYADTRPVASNKKPEGRAKNRRIEIVLVPLDK
ncbi:OmpA family protein [Elusimicrobiota bacterium]